MADGEPTVWPGAGGGLCLVVDYYFVGEGNGWKIYLHNITDDGQWYTRPALRQQSALELTTVEVGGRVLE